MIGPRAARLEPAGPNNTETSIRWLGELDLEYFHSPHWSGELASGPPPRYTAGVGVNANLGHSWFLNADIKLAWWHLDLRFQGTEVSTLKLDPFVYGLGIAYRFGNSPP
jgi:outer membrane protein W